MTGIRGPAKYKYVSVSRPLQRFCPKCGLWVSIRHAEDRKTHAQLHEGQVRLVDGKDSDH